MSCYGHYISAFGSVQKQPIKHFYWLKHEANKHTIMTVCDFQEILPICIKIQAVYMRVYGVNSKWIDLTRFSCSETENSVSHLRVSQEFKL